MIDANCTEFEVDETNNVAETLVSLTDPFEGITWNVYRAEDGFLNLHLILLKL